MKVTVGHEVLQVNVPLVAVAVQLVITSPVSFQTPINVVKLAVLVAVNPFTITAIVPFVAAVGTVVVILVAVEAVTIAAVPLKLTVLAEGVVLKFVPVIVTVVPAPPPKGLNAEMVGGGLGSSFLEQEKTSTKRNKIAIRSVMFFIELCFGDKNNPNMGVLQILSCALSTYKQMLAKGRQQPEEISAGGSLEF